MTNHLYHGSDDQGTAARLGRGSFFICAALLLGLAALPAHALAAVPVITESDRQKDGAQSWLDLMDQGKFQQGWDSASTQTKSALTAATWQKGVPSVRAGLGKRLARGLDKLETATSIDGGPKGEYVIMTFTSSFANKPIAVEKLTLRRELDGSWRMVSYTIN